MNVYDEVYDFNYGGSLGPPSPLILDLQSPGGKQWIVTNQTFQIDSTSAYSPDFWGLDAWAAGPTSSITFTGAGGNDYGERAGRRDSRRLCR